MALGPARAALGPALATLAWALALAASVERPAFAAPGAAPAAAPSPAPSPSGAPTSGAIGIEVDRIEGGVIHLKAGAGQPERALKTDYSELKHLGNLVSREAGVPVHLLFSGRPCADCIADKGIYVIRADGQGKPVHFVYPGKIFEPKTRALVLESRAFFGRCLRDYGDVYVAFQQERVDRRKHLQASVFVAEPGKDHLQEKLLERRLPKLSATVKLVKGKQCHEIEGRNRLMLTKPLDLTPRRGSEDEEESDDETKENQTTNDLPSPTE